MHPALSFITANFVARQLGYRMEKGWMQGDDATQAWFTPLATFHGRFEEMLLEAKALGFSSIDLWGAHLHWRWATLQHVESARALLAKHELDRIASLQRLQQRREWSSWHAEDVSDTLLLQVLEQHVDDGLCRRHCAMGFMVASR